MSQNILRNEDDDALTDETMAYFDKHCATSPAHVVSVMVIVPCDGCGNDECDNHLEFTGVFSTLDNAHAWIETFPDNAHIITHATIIDRPADIENEVRH